ncbi:MAG TPA: hypothetical protein VJR47_20240 [Stellaceae bacterium]|nr:hypothetical protein [Stellaceae bacterium]
MLPDDVVNFIRDAIGSIWALEQLLLMHRERGRSWSVDELTRELRSSLGIVGRVLQQFERVGFAEQTEGRYRYHAATRELDAQVERLVAHYRQFPVAVMQTILESPNHKIQLFADAFRIKKE